MRRARAWGWGGPAGARGTTVSTATGVPDQNNQPSGRLAQLNEKADVTIEQQEAGGACKALGKEEECGPTIMSLQDMKRN